VGTDEEKQAISEAGIEADVDIAYLQFSTARTLAQRKRAYAQFVTAIKARSPETVRRMELNKGLRRA